MNQQQAITTLPPPNIAWPAVPQSKWQREYQAFQRLLPQLLQTQLGRYVAIHQEQVIDTDIDEMTLIARVLAKVGNVDVHVGLVEVGPEPRYRSGVVRQLDLREVM